jgi:hypothetical protein
MNNIYNTYYTQEQITSKNRNQDKKVRNGYSHVEQVSSR